MAEGDFVEPLSGEEIIVDLCALLADKLRKDCNLRESDSYSGGYSAKVTVHLEAYGMDTATVDAEVATGQQRDEPDELISMAMEIQQEPALDQVRVRSDQPTPTLTTEAGAPVVKPRRYMRREQATGGATGETL
jgi:hypothetical protein